jgi:hypothetical protein
VTRIRKTLDVPDETGIHRRPILADALQGFQMPTGVQLTIERAHCLHPQAMMLFGNKIE